MDSLERLLIRTELTQRREEGCDVSGLAPRVEDALADDATDEAVFQSLYDELDALEPDASFPLRNRPTSKPYARCGQMACGAWTWPCPTTGSVTVSMAPG